MPFEQEPFFEVVPSEDPTSTLKNCIIIKEGTRPRLGEIFVAARENGAFEDCFGEEAGDDLVRVQFPGRRQEVLDQDSLAHRLRSHRGGDDSE